MTQPNEHLLQLYRANLKTTLEVMKVCLEGAERLRTSQLQAIQDAKADGAEWRQEMETANSVEELLPIQQRLALAQLENVLGYWSGLFSAVTRAQVESIRQTQAYASSVASELKRSLEQAPPEDNPTLASFNQMLSEACSAYERAAEANEQAIRIAESAIVTADAGIRTVVADSTRKVA